MLYPTLTDIDIRFYVYQLLRVCVVWGENRRRGGGRWGVGG